RDAERAFEAAHGGDGGLFWRLVFVEIISDQVGDDFAVGFRREFVATLDQLFAQGAEVLDDAVMDDGDLGGGVRIGVAGGRRAVGGPARVAYAGDAGERMGC